jgi:AcrR family transcriptional regulator
MPVTLSDQPRKLSPERRARILDAARALILRVGLRRATMEAIAREAGVAKPTLYGYFPDKEAVFEAIVFDLSGDIRSAFDATLAEEGNIPARIAAAIVAKYKVINRVLEGSPHAAELYEESTSASAGGRFDGLERHVEAEIARVLEAGGAQRPRQLAQLIVAAAYGICRKAQNIAEIGPAIRLLVERLVRPELGRQ